MSGRLKVLDFGKVSKLGDAPTAEGKNAHTPSKVSTDTDQRCPDNNVSNICMYFHPRVRLAREIFF